MKSINDASDIEKESLEAHVVVCTIRYNNLNDKLETVVDSVSDMNKSIATLKETLEDREATLTNRIIGWGIYIIGGLLTVCGTILYHYLIAPK